MREIRTRLALGFSFGLGTLMVAFGVGIYLAQRSDSLDQLDERARLESDRVALILREAWETAGEIVVARPADSSATLAAGVASQLRALPDFVVIVGRSGAVHISDAVRGLPFRQVEILTQQATSVGSAAELGFVQMGNDVGRLRYYIRPVEDAGPSVRGLLVALSTTGLGLGPKRLLTTMGLMAPLILAASILIGNLMVGRTLRPVNRMVDEVEAITDGRSLHRRLPEPMPQESDELGRLAATLNAMLSRLEVSFASLRRFTGDASHELKTPLTILRAGVERAITHPDTTPDVLEVLEETLVEVNRMTDLLESLLVLARADEGRAPLHFEDLDLRELMSEISETASLLAEQEGVSVTVPLPEDPVSAKLDRARIRQLIMNLLANAVKYTPRGGKISIEWSTAEESLVLTVRDSGIGIAPGDLPHIFDRFWRVDPARSSTGRRPGAGLGLAIGRCIAEAHGGTIVAKSRPGRGSTFTVIVPRSPDVSRGPDRIHG